MIDIRTLSADDWTVWRDLRLRALADVPHAFGSKLDEWKDAAEDRWRARLNLPGSNNSVAHIAGGPDGGLGGLPDSGLVGGLSDRRAGASDSGAAGGPSSGHAGQLGGSSGDGPADRPLDKPDRPPVSRSDVMTVGKPGSGPAGGPVGRLGGRHAGASGCEPAGSSGGTPGSGAAGGPSSGHAGQLGDRLAGRPIGEPGSRPVDRPDCRRAVKFHSGPVGDPARGIDSGRVGGLGSLHAGASDFGPAGGPAGAPVGGPADGSDGELGGARNWVPVGMATCVPVDGTYQLISMWVAPEARGVGVGDALIEASCRWARERGAGELHLDVKEDNAYAILLYVRHGFVDVGPSREDGERAMTKCL